MARLGGYTRKSAGYEAAKRLGYEPLGLDMGIFDARRLEIEDKPLYRVDIEF